MKDMVVNITAKIVDCLGEQITIENQLLFQRLLANAGRDQVELESGLCFELSSQPASLFNNEGLMNTTNEADLAEAFTEITKKPMPTLPTTNALQWKKDETFRQISQHYVNHVNRNSSMFWDYLMQ